MNSLTSVKTSLICFGLMLFFSGCHKISNELKPYSENISFSSSLNFNGSTVLNVKVDQTIQVGTDSLYLTISNPTSSLIDSMQILVYFQTADEFDQTLDFQRIIDVENLTVQSDTTILLLSHPELPVAEDQIKFVLLNKSGLSNNVLNGVYNGIAGYLEPTDSLPSNNSFCKGVIAADGNFEVWMKLADVEKKCSGQFIDTTDINAIYSVSPDVNDSNVELDTIAADWRFELLPNQLNFRIKLNGQPTDSEDRIRFELNK